MPSFPPPLVPWQLACVLMSSRVLLFRPYGVPGRKEQGEKGLGKFVWTRNLHICLRYYVYENVDITHPLTCTI